MIVIMAGLTCITALLVDDSDECNTHFEKLML